MCYIILICSALNTVFYWYSRLYLFAIVGASKSDEIYEKNRRRDEFMPWQRVYVANSLTISGYRDERKIQNGAETSVKTAVKRSNYAIAWHLQRCILYRYACGRTGELASSSFRKRVWAMRRDTFNRLKFTCYKKSSKLIFIKHREIIGDLSLFLFHGNYQPIGIALAWLISWLARRVEKA